MIILAVDYDGVIVDSILDSLFVSHNAYIRLFGRDKRKQFGGKLFDFDNWPIIQKKYKKEIDCYRSLRPYIRGATDYGLIQKLMEEGQTIHNQQEFDKYRQTVEFDFINFHDEFYRERKRLQDEDYKKWLELEPPYRKVIEGIRQFTKEGVKVMVATSNRREYIFKAFNPGYYDIPVDPDDILDFRFGEDKTSQMHYIGDKYKVDYQQIYFVDDQLAHLEKTSSLGIQVILAGWSYATEEQKTISRRKGIPVIEEEHDFYPVIKQMMLENK